MIRARPFISSISYPFILLPRSGKEARREESSRLPDFLRFFLRVGEQQYLLRMSSGLGCKLKLSFSFDHLFEAVVPVKDMRIERLLTHLRPV